MQPRALLFLPFLSLEKFHKFLPEIDADRRDVSVAEGAVDELAEEARLPDARVAQKEKLEEVVVIHVSAGRRCG